MDADKQIQTAKFGDVNIVTKSQLVSSKTNLPIFSIVFASQIAKKEGQHYGAFHIPKENKGGAKLLQCALLPKQTESCIASLAISSSISTWSGFTQGKTHVVILNVSISNDSDGFYVVAISPNGLVIGDYEQVYSSVYDAANALSFIELTETVSYFCAEGDAASFAVYEKHIEKTGSDSSLSKVPKTLIKKALENKKCSVKRLFKPSNIQTKKMGLAFSFVTISAASYFAHSYLTIKESLAFFSNESNYSEYSLQKNTLRAIVDEGRASRQWNSRNYQETVIEQFIENLPTGHNAEDIAETIRMIEIHMPIYSVDWSMKSIFYVQGEYIVNYERDKRGKGVYFNLDKVMESINQSQDLIKIDGHSLINQAESRSYSVKRVAVNNNSAEKSELLNRFNAEKKVRADKRRVAQRLLDEINTIESLVEDYASMEFSQKWIDKKSVELFNDVMKNIDNFRTLEPRLKEIQKNLSTMEKVSIKDEWVLGAVLDFVTLMQTDSLFKWTYPVLARTYPDDKTLREKNPKNTRNNRNKQQTFLPAIEKYRVEISTSVNETEGKIRSYGVLDMLELAVLVDRPFVTVEKVEYDPLTEQWKMSMLFNRRTPEYQKITTSDLGRKKQ